MTDEAVLLTDVSDRIATLTLNRPKARNALNTALRQALTEALADAEARDDVDVMILTGTDPAFSAGLDLKELGAGRMQLGGDGGADGGVTDAAPKGPFPPRTKPLIGAVNGVAVTGGFELALNCDFLIASEKAAFADTHARVGIMPGWGLTVLLAEAVGVRKAKEISLTGNYVSATQALHLGLVNTVVPHEELLDRARALAADIVNNDQAAVRQLRGTYDQVAAVAGQGGWDAEARNGRAWYASRGFSADSVEERRKKVMERGREQIG